MSGQRSGQSGASSGDRGHDASPRPLRHGRSLEGTAGWFGSIGFKEPRLQAVASAAVELGPAPRLVPGAGTPLAAAAVVGTMAVAARSVHLENGFFITAEGYEYVLNLSAASVALAAMGPGSLSADRLLGLHDKLTPVQRAGLALGVGLAAAATQLATFWERPKPKPGPAEESAETAQPVRRPRRSLRPAAASTAGQPRSRRRSRDSARQRSAQAIAGGRRWLSR